MYFENTDLDLIFSRKKSLVLQNFSRTKFLVGHNFSRPAKT